MAAILALVLQHDEQVVLCAVELALEAGVATKTHVLNVLHRLIDGKAPPASPIDAPRRCAWHRSHSPMSGAMMPFAMEGCVMRHDPASAAVVVMLKALKMYGMAQAVGDLIEQGAPAFDAAVPILSQLLKAEMAEREVRSIAYQIKSARFPAYKDLAGFDFASSEMNEAMVRQLHRGEFVDGADNVVLIGGPGTGKTHIATALGIQAGRASPQEGAVLRHRGSGQCARAGKGDEPGRPACRSAVAPRPHHPR